MFRSKVRTILTIIAIFIGAFTITLTVGISAGVSSYIDKQVNSVGAEDMLIIRPKIETNISGPQKYDPDKKSTSASSYLSSMMTDKDIEIIKSEKNITKVTPFILISPDYISGKNSDKYQIDIHPFVDSMTFDFIAGKISDNQSSKSQIMLTHDYVEALGYESDADAVNQEVTLAIKNPLGEQKLFTATITGVHEKSILSQSGVAANDTLVKNLFETQNMGLPTEISNKYLEIVGQFDADLSEDAIKDIQDSLNNKGYTANTVDDQIGVVKNVIDAITYVLVAFGAIALLAASFGIINTLFMSVQERTKEIGLMKAMGMSRSKVFMLFSIEATMLGFWGSLLGILAAIGAGRIINQVTSETILKDLPGFDLTTFPPVDLLIVVIVIMLIAFLAGTLPARRAAKLDPIEALRYE